MTKAFLSVIAGLIIVIALLAGGKFLQFQAMFAAAETMLPPPPSVSTGAVVEDEWERVLRSVGSLEAEQGVTVTADLPGRVTEIFFTGGASVNKGDKLLQQDISTEQAQLRAALANVDLARASLDRIKGLFAKKVASKSELDLAEATYKQNVAQADNLRALIAKKTVVAPFAGKLGIRLVDIGQDLALGAPIVSLQQNDTLFVNFTLPQKHIQDIKEGLSVRVYSDADPEQAFVGSVSVINPDVDTLTRNVRLQATLSDAQDKLAPGMFVSVELVLPKADEVLMVPLTAISYATYGNSVFVIEEKENEQTGEVQKVARQQFVQLGRQQGDFVSVTKGLTSGQVVATAGLFKLFNGTPVTVSNEVQPVYSLTPSPADS